MRSVVIHVLLLLVDASQRIQPLHLPVSQGHPKKELTVNRLQIPLEIAQLLSNGFAGHFCGVFAASDIFQIIFPGALAVGAGFLPVCRIMENIQKFFSVFSGFVEQGNILGIPNVEGRTGGIYNHGTAISPRSWGIVRVIILGLGFFCLTRFCVPHDHFVDLTKDLRCQPLAEVHHQGRIKRQLFIVIAGIAAEILQVRILLNLKGGLLVGIAVLCLNDTGTQRQPKRLCHIALAVGKQSGVLLLDFQPRNCLGFLDPTVALLQIHANRLLEICQTDLAVAVSIHSRPPSARFWTNSLPFPCTHFTIYRLPCLE